MQQKRWTLAELAALRPGKIPLSKLDLGMNGVDDEDEALLRALQAEYDSRMSRVPPEWDTERARMERTRSDSETREAQKPHAPARRVLCATEQTKKPRSDRHSAKYADYIDSPEWAERRERAYILADFACERCGARNGVNVHLEVHHRSYATLGNETDDDLLVVCPPCHVEEDQLRAARTQSRRRNAQVNGYMRKVYGTEWAEFITPEDAESEFTNWLWQTGRKR